MFLIDVDSGEVVLVADEPAQGLTHCGSPAWSSDGRRILFDAMPVRKYNQARMGAIAVSDQGLEIQELGPGNCPAFSPEVDRFAFLLNPDAIPDAESGVWVMNADGTGSRRVGGYGRPRWSPDGRQFLVAGFGNPSCTMALLDAETGQERPLDVPGHKVFLTPSWAGDKTVVAAIGAEVADVIALLDVTDPAAVKVKEVLWKKGDGADVTPSYPVYNAETRRCVFVGAGPKGMALYVVRRGKSAPAKRLEPEGLDRPITDLAASPDGRYVLFCSDRPDGRPR